MNTWILDTAIARLLSTNAVVLTGPPNSQMVGKPYLGITSRLPVIRAQSQRVTGADQINGLPTGQLLDGIWKRGIAFARRIPRLIPNHACLPLVAKTAP